MHSLCATCYEIIAPFIITQTQHQPAQFNSTSIHRTHRLNIDTAQNQKDPKTTTITPTTYTKTDPFRYIYSFGRWWWNSLRDGRNHTFTHTSIRARGERSNRVPNICWVVYYIISGGDKQNCTQQTCKVYKPQTSRATNSLHPRFSCVSRVAYCVTSRRYEISH